MFTGAITFRAPIKGDGLTISLCEFNPREPGVDKVELEGRNREIMSTVHLVSVATYEVGVSIATKVHTAALDRISFHHGIVIENGQITVTPTHHITGSPTFMTHEIPSAHLKAELEQASSPGEQYYSLFRSARQSMSPVEEFIHVYNLLRMLLGDSEKAVDDFIKCEAPTTPQTPSRNPHAKPGEQETVYTRLRNELGHVRTGGNLDNTKTEILNWVGGLVTLTKLAIESHP